MSVAQPDTKTTTFTTFTTKNGTTTVHLPFLELVIRHAKQGIDQIKTWTTWEQPQNAVLALAFWCLLCLHFWTVLIYIVPLLPLLWTMQRWPTPTAEEDKDSKRNSSLYQQQHIDISVIDCVVALENMIRTSVESLQWEKHPNKTKKMFLVLVYAYVCWVTAHQLVDTCHIVMVTGILMLTWQSPWMIKARESARYPLSILTAIFLGSVQTNSDTCSLAHHVLTHQDKVMRRATNNPDFVFVLVENQRYLGQWQTPSLPFDFPPWTDEAGFSVQPKSTFTLPSSVVQTVAADAEYKKTWTWQWMDPEWRLEDDEQGKRDELGWEYGTMVWTMFDRVNKGWLSTRRRRWIRRATIEYRVEVTNSKLSSTSSPSSPRPTSIITTLESADTNHVTVNNNSNNHQRPPSTSINHASSPIQSPTTQSFYVDSVTSPTVSPRTSTASIFRQENPRRDTFGIPRMSQSTITVNDHNNSTSITRSRSTSLYSTPAIGDNTTTTSLASTVSDNNNKRISREPSKKRREAVWKSIVRT
ncbi:predicted protein [Lichtheimia corymbifera JMRC:FSU:9682]|uniref:TECPR1-like DysF domain-containing protein n=1 Tax=Lichtheimia corymbifera JMRC:FSU:9682 TaxID=1263082 RepID=A0A068S3E5_9FUNG|nr:predicted protein [Lichtheimia corymbifera JMRC:FSU:9682]